MKYENNQLATVGLRNIGTEINNPVDVFKKIDRPKKWFQKLECYGKKLFK